VPTDILIYGIIAGCLVLWLRSLLGTKHGDERQRPNPFDKTVEDKEKSAYYHDQNMAEDDLVESGEEKAPALDPKILSTINDKSVEDGLFQISLADRDFNLEGFLDNAKDAFAFIVTAFAEGDRATLQDLLAQQVYAAFEGAITEREKRGETIDLDVHAIREAAIRRAWVDKKMAYVTIRFVDGGNQTLRDNKDGESHRPDTKAASLKR